MPGGTVPSVRTVHNVLKRHHRVPPRLKGDQPPQYFERGKPNELWQLDFKGPVEVARRRRHPLTVLDDHSRYLLVLELCDDHTFDTTWRLLWDAFAEFGLPDSLLSDNEFGTTHQRPKTLSRFDGNRGEPSTPRVGGRAL